MPGGEAVLALDSRHPPGASQVRSGEVVELAVVDATEEGLDFSLGEDERRAADEARVAHRNVAVRQFGHLDAVAVGATALALPPDEFAHRVAGHAVVRLGVLHEVLLFARICLLSH